MFLGISVVLTHPRVEPANCYYFSVNFCILQKCYNPSPPGEQTYRSIAVLINAKAEATIFNVTFEHVCGGNGNGNEERFHLMASGGWTASLFSRL